MIVTADHVRAAAQQTLQDHLTEVLEQLALELDEEIPPISSWIRLTDFAKLGEGDSPAVVVTCTGLPGRPRRDEDSYQPSWLVKGFVVVHGRTYEETAKRVAWYVAALRTCWMRHLDLGGLSTGGEWMGEAYTELDRDQRRTIAAGSVSFSFTVPVTDAVEGVEALTTDLTLVAYGPTHPALEGNSP